MATPRKLRATVERIVQHTPDVFTVTVRPDKKAPRFRAGQFLHLALDPYDPSAQWPESRVFSIANSPARRDTLTIAYAVKGKFTTRMSEELAVGREVWVKLPYGAFCLETDDVRETVLVAGGTGITPFVSFLERSCDDGCACAIRLFYGARIPELLLFDPLLEECGRKLPDFSLRLFVEEGAGRVAVGALPGRLSLERICEGVQSPESAVYYLAGPPAMIDTFREGLQARGVARENVRVDEWE